MYLYDSLPIKNEFLKFLLIVRFPDSNFYCLVIWFVLNSINKFDNNINYKLSNECII